GADCPIAVVYRASWPDQKIVQGTLADIAAQVAEAGIGKTAMIVVGRALERQGAVSRLYAGDFTHGYRQAKTE
ncbi:MAG: cobalt-precorrin-4 C(11)-methyltransferase, partial [Verrucomicrobiota bacterium]